MANRSPPSPHDIGSTTPNTALAAIAASTALPPCCKMRIAASVASGWLVAAIPCRAITADLVLCGGPAGRSPAIARRSIPRLNHVRQTTAIIKEQEAISARCVIWWFLNSE